MLDGGGGGGGGGDFSHEVNLWVMIFKLLYSLMEAFVKSGVCLPFLLTQEETHEKYYEFVKSRQ